MSELPPGVSPQDPPEPRESACGVALRRIESGTVELLLGLRARDARFMPNHLALPGGTIDAVDRPTDSGAHHRAVAREMLEEAGLKIDEESWIPAGARTTPPMFPVRFRTEFFVAEIPSGWRLPQSPPSPREIERLELSTPATFIERWSNGEARIPPPVVPVLRTLAEHGHEPWEAIAARVAEANGREQRAPRIEFFPDVWMLPLRTETLPPASHTNAWMPGGERFVVIDPGSDDADETERLLEVIERRCELGQVPHAVLLTHGHRDHAQGAVGIASRLAVPLRAAPGVLAGLGDETRGVELGALEDGQTIDLGGMTLQAVATPGHADGHLAFHLVERGLLVAGDLVSGMSTILVDPDSGDMDAYLASLERVRGLGCRALLPGHGPPLPAKALESLIGHRKEREELIASALGHGAVTTVAAIARQAYSDVPEMPAVLTERQTLAHLIRLERRGRARPVAPDRSSWTGEGQS